LRQRLLALFRKAAAALTIRAPRIDPEPPQTAKPASLSLRQRSLALFHQAAAALTMRAQYIGPEPPRPARPTARPRRRLAGPRH